MNQCIVDLVSDPTSANQLATGLPIAFEQADLEIPGNPAVGMLREHVLIGFFNNAIGTDQIQTMARGNQRGHDLIVCGDNLSIKTISRNGGIKVLWTVDQESIANESIAPDCNIFLVQIWWGENKRSVFYIPMQAQTEICTQMGNAKYLSYPRSGTNNRGVKLSNNAVNLLLSHDSTIGIQVNWQKQGLDYTSYNRWEDFWQNHNNGD